MTTATARIPITIEVLIHVDESALQTTSKANKKASKRRAKKSKQRAAGKRGKRSPEELEKLKKTVLGVIKRHKEGIRTEDLCEKLDTNTTSLALPIKQLLQDKKIRKKGSTRATQYFAK